MNKGRFLTYTAPSDVASGDVVVAGHTLGIAVTGIANGGTGLVQIEGVFELPKVSGAVFAVGENLLFDVSAGAFDDSSATPGTGDLAGAAIAVRPGLDGETTCLVKLTPGRGELEA